MDLEFQFGFQIECIEYAQLSLKLARVSVGVKFQFGNFRDKVKEASLANRVACLAKSQSGVISCQSCNTAFTFLPWATVG